jgi:hypothetical protein
MVGEKFEFIAAAVGVRVTAHSSSTFDEFEGKQGGDEEKEIKM